MLKLVLLCSTLLSLQCALALNTRSIQFADSLYNAINKRHQRENFMVSPSSIEASLLLPAVGATGATASEVYTALGFSSEYEANTDLFREAVKIRSSALLKMMNAMYVNEHFHIQPEFLLQSQLYGSKTEAVNFTESVATAKQINDWVAEQTSNKITNLVDPDSLNAATAAVLVNALHFKAEWEKKFDTGYTINRDFTTQSGEIIKVPIMYRDNIRLPYAEFPEYNATAVKLPVVNSSISMTIVLPNKLDGLEELESKLNLTKILTAEFQKEKMFLHLPRFSFEFGLSLKQPLEELGIRTMFGNTADFSKMLVEKVLFKVSEAKHKTFISVDEQGCEAAGASFFQISFKSGRLHEIEFKADHPFVFIISDEDRVHFVGHVVKP